MEGEKMIWIKTSERMPEIKKTVFIVTSDRDYLMAFLYADNDKVYWANKDFVFQLEDVMCWMEIPPLPEEQG